MRCREISFVFNDHLCSVSHRAPQLGAVFSDFLASAIDDLIAWRTVVPSLDCIMNFLESSLIRAWRRDCLIKWILPSHEFSSDASFWVLSGAEFSLAFMITMSSGCARVESCWLTGWMLSRRRFEVAWSETAWIAQPNRNLLFLATTCRASHGPHLWGVVWVDLQFGNTIYLEGDWCTALFPFIVISF